MRKTFTLLFALAAMAVTPAAAQGYRNATPLEGPVKHIVVKGHGVLFLSIARDTMARITSRNPERLTYTYSADNGTLTLDSGAASLWIPQARAFVIETFDYASISFMPGDTLRAENIRIVAHNYSNLNITRPINSDTLTAYTHEHAFIAFDAVEGFVIDLSDREFSHINIDRRSLLIKHRPKKWKKVLGR